MTTRNFNLKALSDSLIESVTISTGKPGDWLYQSITHKPCRGGCGKSITTRDESLGMITKTSNVCAFCKFKEVTDTKNSN